MRAKRRAAAAKSSSNAAAPKEPIFVAAPPLASVELPPPVSAPELKQAPAQPIAPARETKAPAPEIPPIAPETSPPATEPELRAHPDAGTEISKLLAVRERRTRRRHAISFIVAVIVPTLVAALYLAFFSTPRFLAEAKFVVRGTVELLGGDSTRFSRDMSPLSGITNNQESHILVSHVTSRTMVEHVLGKLDLYTIYRVPRADTQLPPDQDPAFDKLISTWTSMVHMSMDTVTGLLTLDVQAYTGRDAISVAQAILDESAALVNEITARARQDRLDQTTKEVELARTNLAAVLKDLEGFRNSQGTVDANYSAMALEGLASLLRDQRVTLKAEIANARASMSNDATPTRTLVGRLDSLDAEIADLESQIQGGIRTTERSSMPQSLAMQETLETRRTLAIERVGRAEAAQSTALTESQRQQTFVMVFQPPSLPQLSTFPQVQRDTFLLFLVFFAFWCLGATYVRNLRDHG